MRRPSSQKPVKKTVSKRGRRGFTQTGGILGGQIRKVSEKRGFSETRLLTHWSEIAGESVARIAQPVKVNYSRQGIGATLTLLCTGANAPMLQMQLPQIIKRVNGCYGYNAISRIHLTQTAPTGFAEPQAAFEHKPAKRVIPAQEKAQLARTVADVGDTSLRQALAALGENILSKPKYQT
jgi:hypothetical protein